MQLALVTAAEVTTEDEQQLVNVAYEILFKVGTDHHYGLLQGPQRQTDGNVLGKPHNLASQLHIQHFRGRMC